jgi:hypothetical protein
MISRAVSVPVVFDDQNSYVLQIAHAELSIGLGSLQTLINRYLLAYEGAPLKDVELTVDDGRIVMKGQLRKAIGIPISARVDVAATEDGRMRLRLESMNAFGVPVTGLLDLFGLKVEDVMKLKRRGVEVLANDILIVPGQVLPPPEFRGKLTRAAIVGNRIVQTYGRREGSARDSLVPPAPSARNYVYFGGGEIRFGKLTMSDADLQLIDQDPRDPFDFFPGRYKPQLVAGYSITTPADGLRTYMPDFDDLQRTRARLSVRR